ncbi:unnamed protein product [Linum trigynum]|uniref:Transmembrane protein n=1 Tax=Linum trigynum TaxID=586398 RepID=A0AAV2DZY9_9ROSI
MRHRFTTIASTKRDRRWFRLGLAKSRKWVVLKKRLEVGWKAFIALVTCGCFIHLDLVLVLDSTCPFKFFFNHPSFFTLFLPLGTFKIFPLFNVFFLLFNLFFLHPNHVSKHEFEGKMPKVIEGILLLLHTRVLVFNVAFRKGKVMGDVNATFLFTLTTRALRGEFLLLHTVVIERPFNLPFLLQ